MQRVIQIGAVLIGLRVALQVRASLATLLVLIALSGCTTVPPLPLDEQDASCLESYTELDRAVSGQGWHDGAAYRLADFPWLRSTRLMASLADELNADQDAWRSWLGKMAATDLLARRYELANLHDQVPYAAPIETRLNELRDCAAQLNNAVLASDAHREAVRAAADVPDDYRRSWRVLGAYPITRLFVLYGVDNLHAEQSRWLSSPHELAGDAAWVRYIGQDAAAAPMPDHARATSQNTDALGYPRLSADDLVHVFQRHAPIWRIETATDADRIGSPKLTNARSIEVDTSAPAEFRYVSYTRFGGQVRMQLNYMVWFPERPRDGFFDLLGGHLDGAIWRVTLDETGNALAAESLHVCGCYYMVFPGADVSVRPRQRGGEPVFVGPPLPGLLPGERFELTRASGSHYLVGVRASNADADVALPLHHANQLRSLPGSDGRRYSLYEPDGLVPGSERRERYLLWTMGVPSPGAMRQSGRHAIAFAGRRHFDDPWLLEERLRLRERDDGAAATEDSEE